MSAGEPVRVEIRGLSAFGPHGVTEAEREVGCRIVLDISFTVAGCTAVADDELDGTVDYGAVAAVAAAIVRERSCRTLEHLCGVIADELAARFEIEELEIRAAKPEPPLAVAIDEVAISLLRAGKP
ncbi:MAG: dihydroneopterin aldolase [Solirubrobacterales bacterium]|nr:dihydroneopterin aldolase [Solirubrobacterales bacterium]